MKIDHYNRVSSDDDPTRVGVARPSRSTRRLPAGASARSRSAGAVRARYSGGSNPTSSTS